MAIKILGLGLMIVLITFLKDIFYSLKSSDLDLISSRPISFVNLFCMQVPLIFNFVQKTLLETPIPYFDELGQNSIDSLIFISNVIRGCFVRFVFKRYRSTYFTR